MRGSRESGRATVPGRTPAEMAGEFRARRSSITLTGLGLMAREAAVLLSRMFKGSRAGKVRHALMGGGSWRRKLAALTLASGGAEVDNLTGGLNGQDRMRCRVGGEHRGQLWLGSGVLGNVRAKRMKSAVTRARPSSSSKFAMPWHCSRAQAARRLGFSVRPTTSRLPPCSTVVITPRLAAICGS
jgi:hypothetical protein